MSYSRIPYTTAAPGADSNDYDLFTTANFPASSMHQAAGIKKLVLNLKNSHLGTLSTWRGLRGSTGTVTWTQISTEAIAAGTSTTSTAREYLLEAFAEFRLRWTNGGSAQTTCVVDMALTDERGAS